MLGTCDLLLLVPANTSGVVIIEAVTTGVMPDTCDLLLWVPAYYGYYQGCYHWCSILASLLLPPGTWYKGVSHELCSGVWRCVSPACLMLVTGPTRAQLPHGTSLLGLSYVEPPTE